MNALLFLLGYFLVLAAVCLYFGWWAGGGRRGSYRARGGFYLSLGFAGVICTLLWLRTGAAERLQAAGIAPHPALREPVGLAAGRPGTRQVWVFATTGPGRDLLAFYRDPAHLSGWRIAEDGNAALAFRQGDRRLVIAGGDDPSLVFTIARTKAGGDR